MALSLFLPVLAKQKATEFNVAQAAATLPNPVTNYSYPEAEHLVHTEKIDVEAEKPPKKKKPGKFKKKKKSKTKIVAEPRKTISKMSYDDLIAMAEKQLAAGQKESAIKYYEKALPRCTDMTELKKLTLSLADLHFDSGDLEKAGKLYIEFGNLYPGDSKAEYVDYKAILSNFYLTLDTDRDQSFTQKTLTLAEKFLDRELYAEFASDVTGIRNKCCEKLVEYEIHVFNHYLTRGSFKSAQNRINYIKKEFLEKLPGIEPRLLTLECKLATRENNLVLAKQKREDLGKRFPEYHDKKHRAWLNEFEVAMSGKKTKAKNRF